MSISIYQATIPIFIRMLQNLSGMIGKAQEYAQCNAIDESTLLDARLAPDMYPFRQQVEIATDMARACAARLANCEIPQYTKTEKCFEDYQFRIANTIAFLQNLEQESINASIGRDIVIKLEDKEVVYPAKTYLLDVILPNFYFHVTVAYAILRNQGVALGKRDYLNCE